MNIKTVLHKLLSIPNNAVKIIDKASGFRLKKENVKQRKFVFSLDEINSYFNGIDGLFEELNKQGFKQTDFIFYHLYGDLKNTIYTHIETHTCKLGDVVTFENHNNLMQNQQLNQPNFLSGHLGNNLSMLGAFVDAERSRDYKKRAENLEETVKDLNSKIRILEEENSSLKLKEATAEERSELRLQKQLLEKKSVFESDGFQKLAQGLGSILPQVLPAMMGGANQNYTQLGAPQNLTPLQNKAIDFVKEANDEELSLVVVVLQNEKIKKLITDYIKNDN